MTKRLSFSWMLMLVAVLAVAQTYRWQEATSGGYTYRYVTNDPTHSRFYTLRNGLTVILTHSNKEPRIQGYVAVKAGSKTDPATNTGLAHYLEHLMFKGTDKYGTQNWEKEKPLLDQVDALYERYNSTTNEAERKQIYRQIDAVAGEASKYSISNEYDKMMTEMGAKGTNAFTSFEQTVYQDDVPASSLYKYLAVQAERFRNPVFRTFHTELEAVYEEKNISMDNSEMQVLETLLANLFRKHNYGQQTTIGTVQHLKNPSLVEIRKYFNTYYVPNNMAIILSGDLDFDTTIARIDKEFAYMQSRPVPGYTFAPEAAIASPIVKEVVSPTPEMFAMAYRLPGNKHKDVKLAQLVGNILSNGTAGLLDLHLVKQQKLQSAQAITYQLNDYGIMLFVATPVKGQTLEQAQALVMQQIEDLKKGNFDDDLIPSIVNNLKLQEIKAVESYTSRAEMLMTCFTSETDWKDEIAFVNDLSSITKQEVVNFANKYFADNYVLVYKRIGENAPTEKIEKPEITPVQTNADKRSHFAVQIEKMPVVATNPVFVDFDKDMQKGALGKAPVLYVQNKDNSLYSLQYRYKVGTYNDPKLALALQYMQMLGTDKLTSQQLSKELYKIASSVDVSASGEYVTVSISGLQENFQKAVALYENWVANVRPDVEALKAFKAGVGQVRSSNKLEKDVIMEALTNYAIYGTRNPFNHTLTDAQLEAITSDELVKRIKSLNSYEQTILYYGPSPLNEVVNMLKPLHKVPARYAQPAVAKEFSKLTQTKNQVYYVDTDILQANIRWIRNTDAYNHTLSPLLRVYNSYFGGGMGSLVFQTIRESKALAYSTFATYSAPAKKNSKYTFVGYVGTQADKFDNAVTAMNELINRLPQLENNFALAKMEVKQDIQNQRITQDAILGYYLNLQEYGLREDINKYVYNHVDGITMGDLTAFQNSRLANKPYTYLVVASKKRLPLSELSKLGEVKELTLEELFGY